MRTVAFSDPSITQLVNRHFVSAWKNRNPNQKFRDGLYDRITTKQLVECIPPGTGVTNVVSVFATPEGLVLNAVPGYLNSKGFQSEMDFAREIHGGMFDGQGRREAKASELFRQAHARRAKEAGDSVAGKAHDRLSKKDPLMLEEMPVGYFDDMERRRG